MNFDLGTIPVLSAGWSKIPGKHAVFCNDPGFLLAAAQALMAPSNYDLFDISYVLIKPDAFAARKAQTILHYLQQQNLVIVAAQPLQVHQQQALNIWRYQWNRATPSRIKASLAIATCGPSLLLALKRAPARNQAPLAVKLWCNKGGAFAAKRASHTLRAALGVEGRYFGFVHVPDEPIDVVREIGNLLGAHGLAQLLQELEHASNAEQTALTWIERLNAGAAPYDFEPIASQPPTPAGESQLVLDQLFAKASAACPGWDSNFNSADWSALQAVAQGLRDNVEGIKAVVDSGEISDPAAIWTPVTH